MKTQQEIDYSGWFEAENIIFGIKSKAIQPDLGISRKFTNELAPSGATYTELMEIISQLDQKVVSYNLPGFRLSLQQTHDVLKVGTVILRYFTIYIQKRKPTGCRKLQTCLYPAYIRIYLKRWYTKWWYTAVSIVLHCRKISFIKTNLVSASPFH